MTYKKHNANLEVIASAEGKSGLKLSKILTGALVTQDGATVLAHDNTTGEVVRFNLEAAIQAGKLTPEQIVQAVQNRATENNYGFNQSVTDGNTIGTLTTLFGTQAEIKETITELVEPTLQGNILTIKYKGENGTVQEKTVDLSGIVTVDINVANMTIDGNQIKLTETDNTEHTIDLSKFVVTTEVDGQGVTTIKQGGTTLTTTLTPEKITERIEEKLSRYVNTQAYTANTAIVHTHSLPSGADVIVQVFDEQGYEVIVDVKILSATTFQIVSTSSETLKVVAI